MHKFNVYDGGYGDCDPEYAERRISWCKENTKYDWSVIEPHVKRIKSEISEFTRTEVILHYTFIFENDEDAMAFKLVWM